MAAWVCLIDMRWFPHLYYKLATSLGSALFAKSTAFLYELPLT